MLPFTDFGTLNMKMAMKIISYIFPEKLTKSHYRCHIHYICDIMNTDWLALINRAPLHLPFVNKYRRISCYYPAIVC
jgi:hypothetical protein